MRFSIGFSLAAGAALAITTRTAAAHEILFFEHLQGGTVRSVAMVTNDLAFSGEDGGRMRRWERDTMTGDWSFTPIDTGYDSRYLLRDVRFGDATYGWAVGYGGRVLRTDNGGVDWSLTFTPFLTEPGSSDLADLYSVRFVYDTTIAAWRGWTVGFEGTIYTSDDAGDSWQALTLPAGYAGEDLYGLAVEEIAAGTYRVWVCGDNGAMLRSSDGGQSWDIAQSLVQAACGAGNLELWDLEMLPGGSGLVVGGVGNGCGESFFTLNGGATWNALTCFDANGLGSPHGAWSTVYGVALGGQLGPVSAGYASQANVLMGSPLCWVQSTDPSLSYLGHPPTFGIEAQGAQVLQSGMFNFVRSSNDGGATWANEAGVDYLRVQDAAVANVDIGCIVGQSYRILRSTDGLQTFAQVHIGPNLGPSLRGIAFSPPQPRHWLAVGDNESGYPYVVSSTDVGVTWTRTPSTGFPAGQAGLSEVALHPSTLQRALVVGAGGRVLNTTDLGASFTVWNSGIHASSDLSSVAFTAGGDAFAVGSPGGGNAAWRSVGAANSWSAVPLKDAGGTTLTGVSLNAVACGAGQVWAVGNDGWMFLYDAGANEFQEVVPVQPPYDPDEDLTSVAIHAGASATHVIVGGNEGGIRYTNGSIWTYPRSRLSPTDGGDNTDLSSISVFAMPGVPGGFRGYVVGRQFQVSRFTALGASF